VLHHLSLGTADLDRAGRFYDAILAPLGYVRVFTVPHAIGYGEPGGGDKLALHLFPDRVVPPSNGFHLAFAAKSNAAVDAFHAAAMANGAEDNGAPGLRPHYGPDYYAAFVIDPHGYELEAVNSPGA
jgi:catechol 2,3-dioxygenase-like lactoylglutathione lyase family enzyme